MAKIPPVALKYYPDNADPMWLLEVEKLLPWFSGQGADIGCGLRTVREGVFRVDIDKAVQPDVLVKDYKLPFKDGQLDFICSIHSFEHFPDPNKTLAEWLRVVKRGGIVGIVHPDVDFTKKQNPEIDAPGLKANPYNKHWHEHNRESFLEFLKTVADLPFILVDSGPACPQWSFYAILRKT